jgi:hypothetical protein
VERPLDSLAADARLGEVADGKLLTLIMALQLRRPDLFSATEYPSSRGALFRSFAPTIPIVERPLL